MQPEMMPTFDQQCEVIQSTYTDTYSVYDIILDEDIREPSYYRQALHTLRTANENDVVQIFLNNGGGQLDTAICFRNSIQECRAPVFAILEGDTHSAAGMIALSCDDVIAKPYCAMMVHNASFGSAGTSQNIVDHVSFISKQTERLVREVYKDFLTKSEIDEVVKNREIWLTDEEIKARWGYVVEARKDAQLEPEDGEIVDSEEDFYEEVTKANPVTHRDITSLELPAVWPEKLK